MTLTSSSQKNTPQDTDAFGYAVIDLASATELRAKVMRLSRDVASPLFAHKAPISLLEVGPWLVRLSKAPEVERALDEIGVDIAWGYYVYSDVDIISLRRSLRRLNLATVPGSAKKVLFRYWDPRVMRVFLDVATEFQSEQVFEFIDRIIVDGEIFHEPS